MVGEALLILLFEMLLPRRNTYSDLPEPEPAFDLVLFGGGRGHCAFDCLIMSMLPLIVPGLSHTGG